MVVVVFGKTNHRALKSQSNTFMALCVCAAHFDLIRIIGISPPTLFAGSVHRRCLFLLCRRRGCVLVADKRATVVAAIRQLLSVPKQRTTVQCCTVMSGLAVTL